MKKYLLPLILIFLLTFTLIGNCAGWLSGYDQRIKSTIDHTKIDDTLSDFPTTVKLTETALKSKQTLISNTAWFGRPYMVADGNTWVMIYRDATHHNPRAAGEFHIRFSTNEGVNWTADDTFTDEGAVIGFPLSGADGSDALGDGILIKAPNGNLLCHVGSTKVDGGDVSIGFLGTRQWRSTDNGDTWSNEGKIDPASPVDENEIYGGQDYFIDGSDIYISVFIDAGADRTPPYKSALYKSANNGVSWSLVSDITSTDDATNEVGIEYLGSNKIIAIIRDSALAKTYQRISTDMGDSWGALTDKTSQLGVFLKPRLKLYGTKLYLFGRAYYATHQYTAIYYSIDDGTNWIGAFYPDSSADDAGYCTLLQKANNDFYMLSYKGTTSDSDIVEYIITSQGEEVFSEFDADSDYMKCAFTSNDGTTQLYAENELFDVSEQKAIYHVKVTSIASDADTDIYYYYDNDHADNTTYIGAINTVAGAAVWDDNFKFVCHMVDDNGNVDDSTSNNNDGTKKGTGEPTEAVGKVGQGQDFDGLNDYITVPASSTINPETGDFTVETVFKCTDKTDYRFIFDIRQGGYAEGWMFRINETSGVLCFAIEDDNDVGSSMNGGTDVADSDFHYAVGRRNTTADEITLFLNGASDAEAVTDNSTATIDSTANLAIGSHVLLDKNFFEDIIDEIRLSKSHRSDAWLKATYNSLYDTLFTYGGEESAAVKTNVMFIFSNF